MSRSSINRPRSIALFLLCAIFFAGLFGATTATAKRSTKPEDVLKGEIVLSEKRFPRKFDSDKEFVKHMRKVDTKVFYADEDGQWSFRYMIFARQPVGTMTAELTYYDITDGDGVKVNTFSLYPQDENDQIISGKAELTPDGDFEPHRKYRVVFSRGYGHKALASTDFILYPSEDAAP